jgi:hypothetical protein
VKIKCHHYEKGHSCCEITEQFFLSLWKANEA